jgi:hypothetical protein
MSGKNAMSRLRITPFWVQRGGNEKSEYEDSYNFYANKVAVADGASEGVFSKLWADLLTMHLVKSDLKLGDFKNIEHFKGWVRRIQDEWKREALERCQVESLPWYVKNKLRHVGAYSTLLALEFDAYEREKLHWIALSVGDVCLFKIASGDLVLSFPISNSSEFTNFPPSISSKFVSTIDERNVLFSEGVLDKGDTLILATDAFSQWFLKTYENGGKPWNLLSSVSNNEDFVNLVNRCRESREMRNDDVTTVVIVMDG